MSNMKLMVCLIFVFALFTTNTWADTGADLIAYWELEGNAIDSINGYNGTVYGAQQTAGKIGDALIFDGINDYVEVTNATIGNPSGSFTVMAWAKATSESQNTGTYGDNDCIISKHISYDGYYIEYAWDSNRIRGGLGDGSSWNRIEGGSWEIDEWHHVALVYNKSQNLVQLFDNGIWQGECIVNSPTFTSFDLRIGNSEGFSNQYFPGIIDDVRMYNAALTGLEITAIMSVPEPPRIEVAVDVKPNNCPNLLNIKSKGFLPVAILGSEVFDVTEIDVLSIQLAGVGPIRSSYRDVATPLIEANECDCSAKGHDGYTDLMLKFDTQAIVTAIGEVNDGDEWILELIGSLYDETPIAGADCVIIRARSKQNSK